jgi:hypothetical protein
MAEDEVADRLLRRLEVEIRAHANADRLTRDVCYGRCLAYLDLGVWLGLWSSKVAVSAGDAIREKVPTRRIMRRLRIERVRAPPV